REQRHSALRTQKALDSATARTVSSIPSGAESSPSARDQKQKGRATHICPPCETSPNQIYSNFSVMMGKVSLPFASDLTTNASAVSAVVLRAVAISLTNKYLARSSIFFSRKDNGLLRLRETKLLRTTATSRREPVRILSEFSLKRCFQSWWE